MRRAAPAPEPRAGMLVCVCDPQLDAPANDNGPRAVSTFGLAVGFAFAVLAQTVASAALPLAGAQLAPRPELVTWPFAALLLGAALASFPASFLRDAFGRRTACSCSSVISARKCVCLAMSPALKSRRQSPGRPSRPARPVSW